MRARGQGIRRGPVLATLLLATLLALATMGSAVASAQPSVAFKTVTYRGYSISVPGTWPVYRLSRQPRVCVRFNQHAVYLGMPGRSESCPGHAAGRSEAILLEPVGASAANSASPAALEGSVTSFVARTAGVRVVATWAHQRNLIVHALHRRALPAPAGPTLHRSLRPALEPRASTPSAHAAQEVYTGPGFDACSAPSPQAMSAWGSSPYRALGIYIGGVNSACAQPSLSSGWVASESAAGWHMIPTYVGLQAPSNSCGCRAITASQASAQGTAAAEDAVSDAQTLGLPAGSPIYDDMEYYARTQANTSAVMAFLSAWTSQLHAEGYLSGVYGNSNSAIADLVARYGTTYPEPDDIWMANWNGQQSTSDAAVPSTDWANHQRLHQYGGGHNETYGHVTINIDSDYLDGATATGGASSADAPPPPTLSVAPAATGMTKLTAGWAGSGLLSWRILAGTDPTALTPVGSARAHGPKTTISVRSSAPYFAVQGLGSGGQVLATSPTAASPRHLLVFGHSVFVGASGVGGLPTGCYLSTTCHVVTTVSVGRLTLAKTGTEAVAAGGTTIVFFHLSRAALKLLNHARGRRLAVRVTVRDVSGVATKANLVLVPFWTRGRAPSHSVTASPLIRSVGFTDFVYARGAGGILTGCGAVAACRVSATLSVGRTTIASTRPELISGRELGYVLFSLTAQGRQMLDRAPGNQLRANLVLRYGSSLARARIALVQFS